MILTLIRNMMMEANNNSWSRLARTSTKVKKLADELYDIETMDI